MTAKPTLATAAAGTMETAATAPHSYDNDVLAKAHYEQELLVGTNTDKIAQKALSAPVPFVGGRNYVFNGALDLNQRGGTTFDASVFDAAPADGWRATYGTWTRTSPGFNGLWLLSAVGNGTNAVSMSQQIFVPQELRGRTITASASVFQTANAQMSIQLADTTHSPTGTVSVISTTTVVGAWTVISVSLTVPSDCTTLMLYVYELVGSTATIDIDSIMLTANGVPVSFIAKPPAIEKQVAKKRYSKIPFAVRFYATAAGEQECIILPFPATMLDVPLLSVSLGATTANINAGAISTTITADSITVFLPATAIGDAYTLTGLVTVDAGEY